MPQDSRVGVGGGCFAEKLGAPGESPSGVATGHGHKLQATRDRLQATGYWRWGQGVLLQAKSLPFNHLSTGNLAAEPPSRILCPLSH